jgi:uncharacterized SAM-binding protein YcdF (DUF218 family)
MFFEASKIFWIVMAPMNALTILLALGALGLFTRWRRGAAVLVVSCGAGYFALGFAPFGAALMRPLEDRFPRPPEPVAAPVGVIVLGGGVRPFISAARERFATNDAGVRLIEAAALAQRFPDARIVFSGGSASLSADAPTEAATVRLMLPAMGVPLSRVTIEERSRNTAENARFVAELMQADRRWLLVTSAFHMPRAMGAFRAAGLYVTPWPVDYRTLGTPADFRPWFDMEENATRATTALREYVGLLAYRLTGRTNALFPAP